MVINSFQYYIFVLQIVTALTFFLTWFHECLLPFWKMCRENYFPPNSSWFNWYKMIFYCLFSSHSCFWTCQHTPCLLSCYPSLTSKSNWRLTARLPVPSAGIADLLWNFLKLIYSDFRVSLVLNSIECILNGKDQGSLQSQFYNLRLKFRNFSLSQNSEDWKITWMINKRLIQFSPWLYTYVQQFGKIVWIFHILLIPIFNEEMLFISSITSAGHVLPHFKLPPKSNVKRHDVKRNAYVDLSLENDYIRSIA